MPVRPCDRRHLDRISRDLTALERHDEPSPEVRQRAVDRANRDRLARNRAPLQDDEEPPESELYRRARALGLGSSRR